MVGRATVAGLLVAVAAILAEGSRAGVEVQAFFSPGGGVEEAILARIEGAGTEVLVAMYQFTNANLGRALVAAHERGVRVLVILDWEQKDVKYGQNEILRKAGVPVRYVRGDMADPEWRRAKFHHKFGVYDRAAVSTGSFNWTSAADEKNWENVVLVADKRLAGEYRTEFGRLWEEAIAE
ncbi:MAG: DUF1669 domain-containing protein [Planctomycetes bacterium]|nr:DUF1669 domain-containing protein [Planctomycetota bacterium]